MSVGNGVALRGLAGIAVDFGYPVTALCGRNGSGKTTLLALAALAFHSPAAHPAYCAPRPHYTFGDFFYRGPGDSDLEGVEIGWRYTDAPRSDLSITKQSDKWMHYARRPERPVYYVGMNRCVPAVEQRVLRAHFNRATVSTDSLQPTYRAAVGEIMGRPYQLVEVSTGSRYSLRRCTCGSSYSSFNMGAGEDVLVELLYLIQCAPNGSLFVIEEIELGLHPAALRRLAQSLLSLAHEKKLQMIVSTHSDHFVDALPREARILLQASGATTTPILGPTTRFMLADLSETAQPEMSVYCEDTVAQAAILGSLSSPYRGRVDVRPIGCDSQLAIQGTFHLRSGHAAKCLIVWDGDASDSDCQSWLSASGSAPDELNWTRLPGGCPPERWLLESALSTAAGVEAVASYLNDQPATASPVLDTLMAISDPHDITFELARRMHVDEQRALDALVAGARASRPEAFEQIRSAIAAVLDGNPCRAAI